MGELVSREREKCSSVQRWLDDAATSGFLLAFITNAVNLKAVTGCEVVVLLADILLELVEFGRKEFDRAATLRTHHMIVTATVVLMFVAGYAIVKGDFAGESTLGEELESALDGGKSDFGVLLSHLAIEFVGGKVVALLKEGLEDNVALAGQLEANALQMLVKDVRRFAQHFARNRGLIINSLRQHALKISDESGPGTLP